MALEHVNGATDATLKSAGNGMWALAISSPAKEPEIPVFGREEIETVVGEVSDGHAIAAAERLLRQAGHEPTRADSADRDAIAYWILADVSA